MATITTACGALAASAAALATYGLVAPRSRLYGPVVWRGADLSRPALALTFDDGPWPGSTDRILDTLRDARVPATFFVIGRYAQRWPGLVERMHAEGHLVANHTFDHHRLGTLLGPAYWRDQIARTDETVERIIDLRPRLFRSPMGIRTPIVARAAKRLGHSVVAWSVRARDGLPTTPERIVARVVSAVRPASVVLLHDGRDPASRRATNATPLALPALIEGVRRRALTPARLDDLTGLRAYA